VTGRHPRRWPPMILNEPTYKLFRPDLENPTADDGKDG
jgi:hypothetical protein